MAYTDVVIQFIQYTAFLIQLVGLAFVIGSVLVALAKLPLKEFTVEDVRVTLARRILFSLEFLIAADIINATVATELSDILRLGGIVIIRVVLGYSIHREIAGKK